MRTQELVAKAAAEGIQPLDVMLKAMRLQVEAGNWTEAAKHAESAAPYLHPRLASVAANVTIKTDPIEDLLREIGTNMPAIPCAR